MQPQLFTPTDWQDYELLDSGNEEKLERFGTYTFIRPEPKALWTKTASQSEWNKAAAIYKRDSKGGGKWTFTKQVPSAWKLTWRDLSFLIKPTGFKHMGLFPEQAAIWVDIIDAITRAGKPTKLLNLFGYTGGSTLAALSAGAQVTHVDAAKDVVTWAHENAKLSQLDTKPVRWIVDDAVKFVRREIKRGNTYDAIIMDPPKFGRGANGQVWKIEEHLPQLVELCKNILNPQPLFFIINAYTIDFSSLTLYNILRQTMLSNQGNLAHGELILQSSQSKNALSTGIIATWFSAT